MRDNAIDHAIKEARRFIEAAIAWKSRLEGCNYYHPPTKEGGAAKRASMDLTRALTELRK